MSSLAAFPDLSHLKKQAKQLLRGAHAGDVSALERFSKSLPALRGIQLSSAVARELRLHDAQSVVAREYGFPSWPSLKRSVDWVRSNRTERLRQWFEWIYEGGTRELKWAISSLREEPDLFAGDLSFACATGDTAVLRTTVAEDSAWPMRAGGPLGMPPLVAVTQSTLILEPEFERGLLDSARLLLEHGADVNGTWTNPKWPEWPLSALHGAAGRTHHVGMLQLLLEAGADPNDNESLYHSLESRDSTCTQLLLKAGARVTGTNAIARALDYGKLYDLQLLLENGGDARERPWIHHAILRGRSIEFIRVLVEFGADLRAVNREATSLYRWAELHGRTDVLAILRSAGIEEALSEEDQFVAACARGDELAVRAIREQIPDIFSRLSQEQLRLLPERADTGDIKAVRTMLNAGWPREVKAAWNTTALNLAVYRGDADMANLLLSSGACWETIHGFKDNVFGTLSHASQALAEDPSAPGDYLGCAKALIAHHAPLPEPRYTFSDEVANYFDTIRLSAGKS
jgi:ankyrin repeat protein